MDFIPLWLIHIEILKGGVHPDIKLFLIKHLLHTQNLLRYKWWNRLFSIAKWEEKVDESLSKFRLKIRKLLWSFDQSNTNRQLCDASCEFHSHLLHTQNLLRYKWWKRLFSIQGLCYSGIYTFSHLSPPPPLALYLYTSFLFLYISFSLLIPSSLSISLRNELLRSNNFL